MSKCVGGDLGDDAVVDHASEDASCVATKVKKRKIKFVCKDGKQYRLDLIYLFIL